MLAGSQTEQNLENILYIITQMEENIFHDSQLRNKQTVHEEMFLTAGKTPSVIGTECRLETPRLLCTETHISNSTNTTDLTFTSAASNPTYAVACVITSISCPGRRINSHDGHKLIEVCSTEVPTTSDAAN